MSAVLPAGGPIARVTAAILTRDEAEHLPACLKSVGWTDAVLVLDSNSEDETRAIALEHGARVVEHPFENFSIQRQRALELIETDWVLFVDADERVSPALAFEIRNAIVELSTNAFWIPRENDFWGHRLRGGGWWPDRQLRLLRVSASRYDPRRAVHELAEVEGEIGTLSQSLFHLNYSSMPEFKEKQQSYGRLEADRRIAEGDVPVTRHLLTRPVHEFVRRFVSLGGYRDGLLGARLAVAMAVTELQTIVEVHRRLNRRP